MRAFIGLTSDELTLDNLPTRGLIITGTDSDTDPTQWRGEELEVAEYAASIDASLVSLNKVRERLPNCAARRIVAAIELDGDQVGGQVADELSWGHVESFLVDEVEAEPIVRSACAAQTQDEADTQVSELLLHCLAWWDGSERNQLVATLPPVSQPEN